MTVLSRVGEEYRKEQELVPTPHRPLEGNRVLGRVKNRGNAMKTLVQVNDFLIFFFTKYVYNKPNRSHQLRVPWNNRLIHYSAKPAREKEEEEEKEEIQNT